MKEIRTKRGFVIRVSDEDFELVSQRSWVAMGSGRTRYAICARRDQTVLMHRLIMSPGPGQVVDHINHDGLDNRRSNLRLCTQAENARHKRGKRDRAGFKGVYWSGYSWQALIHFGGKLHALGRFQNPEDAARAYDKAAREFFGQFAVTNFESESHNDSYVNSTIRCMINERN